MSKEVDEYRKRRQARLDAKKAEQRSIISAYRQRRWDRLDARGFSFEDILNITTKGSNKSSQSLANSDILRGKPLTGAAKYGIINRVERSDEDDKDVIYRTAENGNKYAINAETGEILGGLGPELEGQKVGRVLSEQAPSVQKMFDSLDKMPVGTPKERQAFAAKLIDNMGIDRLFIAVRVGDMEEGAYGYCESYGDEDGITRYVSYNLNKDDDRSVAYQTKTAFHEAFHLSGDGRESDRSVDEDKWRAMEETFAETSAHYAMELMGHEGVIHPSYADVLIDTLPRLARTEEFADCITISDFGKVALEKRLAGGDSKWIDVYDKAYSNQGFRDNSDRDRYVRSYVRSIEENADTYLEQVLDRAPNLRPQKAQLRKEIDDVVKMLHSYEPLPPNPGAYRMYSEMLVAAMNKEGVF